MSATLTWANSGNGTKTGTAVTNLISDLATLITSFSANSAFFWQVAGSNIVGTPVWLLLSPKDGSNRRIAIICWTSSPAANNAAILDATPASNQVFICYFPNGSANTLSNLTAASGTICGNDTGCLKVAPTGTVSQVYAANILPFYQDCAEAMLFGFGNPAAVTVFGFAAGSILVDAADVAYDAVYGPASNNIGPGGFGASTGVLPFAASKPNAGSASVCIRSNYSANDTVFYHLFAPTGVQFNQSVGASDILTNTAITQVGFVAIQLVSNVKLQGFPLRLRQIAWGPGTTGPFEVRNISGPTVNARSHQNLTAGGNGAMWTTQYKI